MYNNIYQLSSKSIQFKSSVDCTKQIIMIFHSFSYRRSIVLFHFIVYLHATRAGFFLSVSLFCCSFEDNRQKRKRKRRYKKQTHPWNVKDQMLKFIIISRWQRPFVNSIHCHLNDLLSVSIQRDSAIFLSLLVLTVFDKTKICQQLCCFYYAHLKVAHRTFPPGKYVPCAYTYYIQ